MCAFLSQSYTFLLIEDCGIPFGEKATRDIREYMEGYGEKGNILRQKWKEDFCETAL